MPAKKLYKITRNGSKIVYNLQGQVAARETLQRITDNLLNNNGRYVATEIKRDKVTMFHAPTETSDLYAIEPN